MQTTIFKTVILFLCLASPCFAHRTAQEAAEASAAGGLRHRGGNAAYEGLGCANTPERAFRSCCYASHSGLITYDCGVAQGRNGLWVVCRRYVSRSQAHRIPSLLARAGLTRQRSTLADCWAKEEVIIYEDTSTSSTRSEDSKGEGKTE